MDERIEETINTIEYVTLAFITVYAVLYNIQNPWKLILLAGVFIFSHTIRNSIIYNCDRCSFIGKILAFVDTIIIFLIAISDRSGFTYIYSFVLIADVTLAYTSKFSIIITAVNLVSYFLSDYISKGYPDVLTFFSGKTIYILAFILVPAIMNIIKLQIKQKEILDKTMLELRFKARELENVNTKLKETAKELEEVTVLNERNRIAREIHDTVGHTLTSVLLQLEAGERLMPLSTEQSVEKIRMAKIQVRKGLGDIRESVRTLKEGKEIAGFIPSVKLLIEEIIKNGDIFIKYEISKIPVLSPEIEKVFFRALQEGVTNGIKHGKSTAFVFKLTSEKDCIKFFLQDNGKGTDNIIKGFGLSSMEERVKEIGGEFNIYSKKGEGFSIEICVFLGEDGSCYVG